MEENSKNFDQTAPLLIWDHMSRDMRFPTMWYVQPAMAQTSLCMRAVWPEP